MSHSIKLEHLETIDKTEARCSSVNRRLESTNNVSQNSSPEVEAVVDDEWSDPRDHGYAWVVAALSFILTFVSYCVWAAFGVYLTEWKLQNPDKAGHFALIFSLYGITFGLTGLISGSFLRRLGTRATAVCGTSLLAAGFMIGFFSNSIYLLGFGYSLLIGIGNSWTAMAAAVANQQYFNKRRAFATGLVLIGGSAALFSWPPLVAYIIGQFGWRAAFLAQSALALHGIPVALLIRPVGKHEKEELRIEKGINGGIQKRRCQEKPSKRVPFIQFGLFKNIAFAVLLLSSHLFVFAHETPIIFLVSRAVRFDIPLQQASFMMSVWAIASLPARALVGWLGDKTSRCGVMAVATIVAAVANGASIFCTNLPTQIIYSAVYGFFTAGYIALSSPVLVDFIGVQSFPAAFGILIFATGLASLLGPIVSDLLIELTGDYVASFLMAGSLQMCSGILMLTSMGIERYQKGRKQTKMTAHNVEVELAPLQIDENEKLDNAPST